jgi:gliding motility-associated-like protein
MPKIFKSIVYLLIFFAVNPASAQLAANFTTTDKTQDCPPFIVHFNSTSTGNPTTYTWTVKLNGNTYAMGSGSTVSWSFGTSGSYDITLTVTNGSGPGSTITKTGVVVAYDTPAVSFTATPNSICAGQTVTFNNTSSPNGSPATYRWIWGDNTPDGNTQSPTHVYNNCTGGPYSVTLIVTNSHTCQRSLTHGNYISVNCKPQIAISANKKDFCTAPASVTLTGQATGVLPFSYLWSATGPSFSQSSTSNPWSYSFPGPAPKSYDVKLVVTDGNGCKDSSFNLSYINIYKVTASFTAPAGVCIGIPITFTNTSTPLGGLSIWDLANVYPSYSPSPLDSYYTAGTYSIKLNYNVNGCVDTVSKSLTVYPRQLLSFKVIPDSPCPAPATIQFKPQPKGLSYLWNFGDYTSGSNTSTLDSPFHTYLKNGWYDVSLISTDGNGCKDTSTKFAAVKIYDIHTEIRVTNPLNVKWLWWRNSYGGCLPLTVNFDHIDSTFVPAWWAHYPYSIKSYQWDFGDPPSGINNFSTLATPSHTYTDTGVHRVILQVTTKNNCTSLDTIFITPGMKPTASFICPDTICYREELDCFSTSPIPPVDYYRWQWGRKPPLPPNVPVEFPFLDTGLYYSSIAHKWQVPKIDTVKLVTYNNGCPSDTFRKGIVIDSPKAIPVIVFKCRQDSLLYVQFIDSSIGGTWHMWYFGDGGTSTASNPLHKYAGFGVDTVMLVVYNSRSDCYDTSKGPITLINPVPTLTVNDTTICRDDTLGFRAKLTGANPRMYTWFINNLVQPQPFPFTLIIPPGDSFLHVFNTTGYYTVKVYIADDHNCNDTAQQRILVSRPNPSFVGVPVSGCTPFNVSFTDQSTTTTGATIANRFWDFGNGTQTNPSSNPFSHTYNNPGSFDVRLVITDDVGCKDSMWKFAYIQGHHPQPAFASQDTGCIGNSINFASLSTFTDTCIWDFGDNTGITYNVVNPSHTYSALGSYTVKLLAKDIYGCKDSLIKPAKVTIIKPTANFTIAPDSITACPVFNATFTSTSTGNISTYTWDFGDATPPYTSGLPTATHTYLTPKYYTVTLIVTNTWGCIDSIKKHVNMLGYSGSGNYHSLLGCVPLTDTFYLTNLNNIPSITWDFNDGNTLAVTNSSVVTHTYTVPGAYLPKLILGDAFNCKTSSPGTDTIKVDVSDANFRWGPACEYNDIDFFDSSKGLFSAIAGWLWTFDNNQTSTKKDPTHHYGPKGTYNVSLSVTSLNGCFDTIVKAVTVNALPVISAGGDTIICLHDSATLYPSGGVSYVWSPANYLSCVNCTNPLAGPPVKYHYYVVGTDANGCKNTDTVEINIKTKVTAITGKGGEICDLDSFHLHVSGAHHYLWIPADGLDNYQSANPIAAPHQTTVYTVVSFEGRCIPDTDLVELIIHPLPTVKARGEQTIIAGNTADVQASGDRILKFAWSPSESVECPDCPFTTVKPTKTTTYTVHVYTDFGCVDSDKVTITVLCDKSQLFIPNTFTPNGDGQNDVFYPRGTGLDKVQSFRIYNRWGEVVFERAAFGLNDKTYGWDGTFKGEKLPPDVFVYVIEALCDDGKIMTIKGDVTIVH